MDTDHAAQHWALTWRRAWPERDLDAVVGLYTAHGVHRSAPFRQPYLGAEQIREYFRRAFDSETADARVWFGDPLYGDGRATVEWWAETVAEEGPVTLAGCSVIVFDGGGKIVEQRDYWHEQPGHVGRPFI